MKTGTLHFKIGEGLSNLVRDAFWYEQKFEWAIRVFECFDGLVGDQINAILAGDAWLKPIGNGTQVEIVYEEDKEFKKALAKHTEHVKERIEKLYKEIYKLDKIKDKLEFGMFGGENPAQARLVEIDKQNLKKKVDDFAEVLFRYDRLCGKRIVPALTTEVGGYKVPNNLLDEYINDVVRRIRMSIKTGSLIHENPMEMLELEQRRKLLHDRILEAVGFGKAKRRGEKYQKFSDALEAFLESMGAGLYDKEIQ